MSGSSELQKAVDRLREAEPRWKAFDKKPQVGGRSGSVSTGRGAGNAASSVDLVESDASLREYYDPRTLTTSDGLFTIEQPVIKKIFLVGGGTFEFQEPPA